MIASSRAALGEAWLPAWLEAPVWRFALSPDICGPDAVIGLWMPSVDRIGRYYPLTVAAINGHAGHTTLLREANGFLEAAERAGRDALDKGLPPDELEARLISAATAPPSDPGVDLACADGKGGLWWTKGGSQMRAGALVSRALPDENTFSAMVDPCNSIYGVQCPHQIR